MKKTGIHLLLLITGLIGSVHASAGIAICRSLYDDMQTQAALQHCLPLAEDGNGEASFILSNIYSLGIGVDEPNLKQALLWLNRSAKQGYGPGCFNLGALYERGEVLGLDYKSAFEWYLKGAEADHAPSQSKVGTFYLRGVGTGTDFDQARHWLTKAARQGDQNAQVMLATLIGEKDQQQAIDWYKEAAKQDNAYAYHQLALIFGEGRLGQEINYDRALLFATESVRLGRLSSQALVDKFSAEQARLRKQRESQIIEQHNTAVRAESSEPEQGTEVVATLRAQSTENMPSQPVTETATGIIESASTAGPNGLRNETWLMQQPSGDYVMQLIQLTDKGSVDAFLKKHNLKDKANYYRAHTRAGKVFVVLYADTDPSLSAVKAKAEQLPDTITKQIWYRTYRSLQKSFKPVD